MDKCAGDGTAAMMCRACSIFPAVHVHSMPGSETQQVYQRIYTWGFGTIEHAIASTVMTAGL